MPCIKNAIVVHFSLAHPVDCPSTFITIVRQLHDNTTSCVSVACDLTDVFVIETGVKHGCVPASLLFIPVVIRKSTTWHLCSFSY